MKEIGYCGHHCDLCPYTDCPGCRTENPQCSYATLFEDKKCPNMKCCINQNIDGCYECNNLEKCNHGFYSTKEIIAKATAIFLQKYGKSDYDRTLRKGNLKGIKYPQTYNELSNVGKILELLEKVRNEEM